MAIGTAHELGETMHASSPTPSTNSGVSLRIAMIAGEYPPLQGGLGDYTRELSRALVTLGHEVHVITKVTPHLPAHEIQAGVQVHRLVARWGWRTADQLKAFIAKYQPDILNLQFQTAAYQMHGAMYLLPRFLRHTCPIVVTFHDLLVPYLFPKAGGLRRRAVIELARTASCVIVTNEEDHAKEHQYDEADEHVTLAVGRGLQLSVLIG